MRTFCNLLAPAMVLFGLSASAQNVAINSTGAAPSSSAMLDISSTTSGLLIPRMTTAQRTAIASPAQGLVVYDTSLNLFYYYDGTQWIAMFTSANGWGLAGNTLAGTELMGSLNPQPVRFFSNSAERMRIMSTGEVVVGNTAPFAGDKLSAYGSYAVNGYSTVAGGSGVYGSSSSATGFGMWATNSAATGTGIAGMGAGAGSSNYLTNGSGGAFTGNTIGLASFRLNTTNVNGEGSAYFLGNSAGTGQYAYISYRNAGTWYKIIGTGTVSTIVSDTKNERVTMFCPEAPEIFFQDFGKGQLVNGRAHITLDEIFTKNIIVDDKHPLRVFIQLGGDCKGTYVTNETQDGFDVIELQGGNSNVPFTWFVTANRADEVDASGNLVSKNANVRFPTAPGMMPVQSIEQKKTIQQEK